MQDRDGAEVDVKRIPRVAPHRPERPPAAHVHAEVERHRQQRHHYVRHRQRHLQKISESIDFWFMVATEVYCYGTFIFQVLLFSNEKLNCERHCHNRKAFYF